jgi:uncharacterized damage-inducible protein DinB
MITVNSVGQVYEYNYWARDRQLEACRELSEPEFMYPMGSSFSSMHDTLVHLVVAEWIWLERFCGRSPRTLPSWLNQLPTLASIVQRWRTVELGMRKYLAEIDRETLIRPLTYVNMEGKEWTYTSWQALLHLVNHQTYHRGQVTTLLRQLGKTPPSVDFLVYLDLCGSKVSIERKPHVKRSSTKRNQIVPLSRGTP